MKYLYLKVSHLLSHLNIEDITDADYTHPKGVCKDYKIKCGEYHDLYVQSDTLLEI